MKRRSKEVQKMLGKCGQNHFNEGCVYGRGTNSLLPFPHRHPNPVAWHSSNVIGRINEVALRRAWLVLGWVTVFGGQTTSVFHQATQANSASYPQGDGK